MTDLIFITSVIDIPNTPLSYTSTRSIYTPLERFEQTKRSIESIRKYMKCNERDLKIMIIECSQFAFDGGEEIESYLRDATDYYINIWNRKELHAIIYGLSKAWGEMTLISEVIKYIKYNGLVFENIYKLSGRYEIKPDIDMNRYLNDKNVLYYYNESQIVSTVFYKIRYNNIEDFIAFINESTGLCMQCIGLEVIFMNYVRKLINMNKDNIKLLTTHLDIRGNVAIDGCEVK